MTEKTGSKAQDALRQGYQTSCSKGMAVLLKVDDLTVEACKDFKPRAVTEAQKYIDERQKRRDNWEPSEPCSKWEWVKRIFITPKKPDYGVLFATEPRLNVSGGVYDVKIMERSSEGEVKKMDSIVIHAKLGRVKYDDFDTYSESIIPEEVLGEIKQAQELGLNNIKIAYSTIGDAPQNDPYVVGFIKEKMYIIDHFGFKELLKEKP